ncbi:MAG: ABC transporter substrate-binding protein [Deltaproteobacteria bacterium]|nr:ABC transporter substrate-binding protein [Deltaproteobacteria bacterium]
MKRHLGLPALLILLATSVSFGAEPLKIGVLAPLSGPFAANGASFVQAATLAVEQANAEGGALGRRIEIAVADTEGRVDAARSETLRLISRENVDALVGAYLSEETMGVMETASARKTIHIVPVAATTEITDRIRQDRGRYRNVFRISYSIPQWAETLAAFLKERRTIRYAFVGTGIRWNRELGNALEKAAARMGIGVSYAGYYSPGNPAFDPAAVAAGGSGADIIVLGDPGKNSLSFLKRLRELSPWVPVLSVGGALGDARLLPSLPLTGPLYVQAAAWKGSTPSATAYVDKFEKRFGSTPVGYSDTLPYDAVTVLVAAWRQAGSAEWTAVAGALEKGTFQGVAGSYRFDDSHQAVWGTGADALRGTIIRWERDGGKIVFPPR